ncbi:MAG: class I SAM-dependent methyltransferase [Solirubrobacterales bacterium]
MSKLRKVAGKLKRVALPTKEEDEMSFWINDWDAGIRAGKLWGPNTLEYAGDTEVAEDYLGRRWQAARAEVNRILDEAGIEDKDYFKGKNVLDIGPGCVGFPDAVAEQANLGFGLDPLAQEYKDHDLLLEDTKAIYLNSLAETIPLLSDFLDVVVCRNALDHVEDPVVVMSEIHRTLKPGGILILNVDLDAAPTPAEPHEITKAQLYEWLKEFNVDFEDEWEHGHAGGGHAIVVRAVRP